MIVFILFLVFQKPQEDAKRAQQKMAIRDSRSWGIQELLSLKNRNQPVLFLIERSFTLLDQIVFQTLVHADSPMGDQYVVEITLKKQVSMPLVA